MYQLTDIQIHHNDFLFQVDKYKIDAGKLYVIVGPNGSGKSSFLNLLGFLDVPDKGHVLFKNKPVDYTKSTELFQYRRRISYLLQNPYLFTMNVFDNVASGLRIRNLSEKEVKEKTNRLLNKLALAHLSKRNVISLSGGEAQQVSLARTLNIDADIYLLDEPTANVDKTNIDTLESHIISINKKNNATVLLSTHSREQAYRMTNHLISIINGKIKDLPYENVFTGKAIKDGSLSVLPLADSVRIKFGSGETGLVTIAIDPNYIILSTKPIMSSALNSFQGTIQKIESYDGSLQVFVDTGVTFCTLITQKSFHDLKMNIGSKVWVTFKANSVQVI